MFQGLVPVFVFSVLLVAAARSQKWVTEESLDALRNEMKEIKNQYMKQRALFHELKQENMMQQDQIEDLNKTVKTQQNLINSLLLKQDTKPKQNTPVKRYGYTSFGCPADEISLSCSNGKTILVSSADYGQDSRGCETECCPPHPLDCIEIMSESNADEWLLLKLVCDNQTSCTYLFNGMTFVDECSPENYADYLAIYYSCLPASLDEFVGFTAYATEDRFYDYDDLLIFDGIVSNFGGYYNVESSTFICPYDGIYLFSVNILSISGDHMGGYVTKDNSNILGFVADADTAANTRVGVSNLVITECLIGQKVWVRGRNNGDGMNSGARDSSFSGYILKLY